MSVYDGDRSDGSGLESETETTPLLIPTRDTRPRRKGNNHVVSTSLRRSAMTSSRNNISPIVEESSSSITIRRPLTYCSINEASMSSHSDGETPMEGRRVASLSRYKYYNKLSAHAEPAQSLLMPHHVVPPKYFMIIPIKALEGKQHSIITIFSLWNTMMGTSLLSLPWALGKAGFGMGLLLMLVIAGLALYTAYRVVESTKTIPVLGTGVAPEFSDVCRYYLGRIGEWASMIFSFIALLGVTIIFWVLMTNFLYNTVSYIYANINHEMNTTQAIVISNISYSDAYCPNAQPSPTLPNDPNYTNTKMTAYVSGIMLSTAQPNVLPSRDSTFHAVWDMTRSVPFFLILFVLPLANFKSPTFFTKFNALGTLSVMYILVFVSVKAARWGFHMDFQNTASIWYIPEFSWTFPALTGTLSLAYFIHNCVISITQNQQHPENNGRDLSIAYVCVALTYLFVGTVFYCAFPLPKSCIEDNLLNNFRKSDLMAFVARICLFVQMMTIFPLVLYIIRAQFMHAVFGNVYPSLKHVFGLNCLIITICILFAVFLPQIGTIIRFSGAVCGLMYIIALPCLVYIMARRETGTLTKAVIIFHIVLIGLGLLNFIGQFTV